MSVALNALNQLNNELLGELHIDNLHKQLYATDASIYRKTPLAVSYPKNKEDLKKLIHFASTNKTSLVMRTAGTSLAGQCVGEGIIVDVSKHFTKILDVDIENKQVTVQPGVVRDELNEFLKPYGLFFGPNTSTSNRCMIGGMVGNNSSGTTSIKYGVTRDKVVAIKGLLSDGSETFFGKLSNEEYQKKLRLNTREGTIYKTIDSVLKNEQNRVGILSQFPKPQIHRRNTGYALDSLLPMQPWGSSLFSWVPFITGSEGTLAISTEITLQLDELPPTFEALVVTHYDNLNASLQDVVSLMKHDLYTCEMIDDTILNCTTNNKKYDPYRFFVKGNPKTLLLNELRADSEASLDKKVADLLATVELTGRSYAFAVLKGNEITMAMELRKAGLGLLGNMIGDKKAIACIEDTAVALEDLPAYIDEFSQLMEQFQQDAVYYAHAGAGELHLRPILNLKEKEDVASFVEITTAVAHLCKKYQGSFSGEHGDGIVRSGYIPLMIGQKNYNHLKEIKKAFDPLCIFNPGKIVDAFPMDENLRTHPDIPHKEPQTFLNFEDSQGLLRLAEKCNGSGDCRKSSAAGGAMCPSYQATKNEKDTTRARANVLREVLSDPNRTNTFDSKELKEVMDLCISCKACGTECPSTIDISTAKAEFLYQYQKINGTSLSTKLFAKSSYFNKRAAQFPKLANVLFSNAITSAFIKKVGGIAPQRELPNISTKALNKSIQNTVNQNNILNKKVYLFVDEFSNYLDTEIANDAIYVLQKLGYKTEIISHLDSARALLSKGFLEEAKKEADKNVTFFKDKVSKTSPLLGIEPSAILGFRDEYQRLATDTSASKEIAKNTFLIEEFIASEIEAGVVTSDAFTAEEKNIKIHVHCHQKALSNQAHTFTMLNIPQNYRPTIMATGCCGMAGSFGYEKNHYKVSMSIGELQLFPKVRKASLETIIAANGISCREQIKDGTQRIAKHPITILKEALL